MPDCDPACSYWACLGSCEGLTCCGNASCWETGKWGKPRERIEAHFSWTHILSPGAGCHLTRYKHKGRTRLLSSSRDLIHLNIPTPRFGFLGLGENVVRPNLDLQTASLFPMQTKLRRHLSLTGKLRMLHGSDRSAMSSQIKKFRPLSSLQYNFPCCALSKDLGCCVEAALADGRWGPFRPERVESTVLPSARFRVGNLSHSRPRRSGSACSEPTSGPSSEYIYIYMYMYIACKLNQKPGEGQASAPKRFTSLQDRFWLSNKNLTAAHAHKARHL